ncbi:flagellar hook-length control protein [Pandoraea communis]|uniref:Flagellar hook-length control protein n=1 Tax=Pandoraea communis TaxID=2508297 RepID=A0A5E4YXR1_9BURK|nr:flagellar hook-length control protein FliK [Pandoraea communis]VVE53125.1 flagellar hook-length control protein [Pandoraea communis]
MIVEYSRLMTPAHTDLSAPVADGALPIGLAQGVPSPAEEDVLSDFAATLGRSTAQGLELPAYEADAVPETPEQALKAGAPERVDVAPVAGAPVVADMPEITPDLGELSMADDAARDVPITPGVMAAAAGDSVRAAQDIPSRGIESLRDPVLPHIAMLLAAHEHRMRGTLESHAQAEPGELAEPRDGAASAMTSSPAAAVRAAFPVATPPGVSLPLGLASPLPASLTVLPLAADPATPGAASVDNAAAQALRTTFAAGTFGNTFVGEPSTVAMPGGFPSTNGVAGDGTPVARTLSERVQTMTQNGVHEARLRLTPDELGDIAIVVRKSAMQLSVSLQVARPEALSLVQSTAALLRDMLSQRHAGDVNVSVGSMPSSGGDGASGNGRERHSRDERSGDVGPGLALGEAARQREAFRL